MANQFDPSRWRDICYQEVIFDGYENDGYGIGATGLYGQVHWSGAELMLQNLSQTNTLRVQIHESQDGTDWTLILPVDGSGAVVTTQTLAPLGAATLVLNANERYLRVQLVDASGDQISDPDGVEVIISQYWPVTKATEVTY